jgi:hypothetical protein
MCCFPSAARYSFCLGQTGVRTLSGFKCKTLHIVFTVFICIPELGEVFLLLLANLKLCHQEVNSFKHFEKAYFPVF